MASSILELILRSRKEGDAARKTKKELEGVSEAAGLTAKQFKKLKLGLIAFAGATVAFIGSATKLAARVEMLGVVTIQLGKNVGLTEKEVRSLEEAIQDQGITTEKSRQALAKMIQGNIDLANSTDLARLSQDAAVIAGWNSSEAFEHLINVIVTGNVRMGRTIGLQLQFGKALQDTARALGKNVEELTDQEIIQARTNEVLRQGATIAGTYEAAMGTAGKQMLSMERQLDEIRLAIGQAFLPTLTEVVGILYEIAKVTNEVIKRDKEFVEATDELDLSFERGSGGYIRGAFYLDEYGEKVSFTRDEVIALAEAQEIGTDSAEDATEAVDQLAKAVEGVDLKAYDAKAAISEFWSVLREGPGIVSALESNLEAIDYSQAGAGAVEEAREGIESALATGIITEAEAEQMFGSLYVAAQQIEVELGNITAYQAALNIRNNIGGTLQDARNTVGNLEADLAKLVEKELLLRIRAIVSYGTEEGPGGQHGLSMTVPPGYPNDTYPLRATSGEHVEITPAGQTIDNSRHLDVGGINVHNQVTQEVVNGWIEQWMRG